MKDFVFVFPVGSIMIWDQYFLARVVLVIFSMIAATCWSAIAVAESSNAFGFPWILLVPIIHSVGMTTR